MMCRRDGCERQTRRAEPCCSSACKAALNELQFANHLAEYLGHSDHITAYISAAEELGRALTTAQTRRYALQALAIEAGWSAEDFERLCRGQIAVAPPEPDTGPLPASVNPRPDADTE